MEDTIQQNRQIIFRYFDLNENDEKVYRQDGHQYVVESVALVFNEDNCHLVVYSGRHDSTANYRVDRMDGVEIIGEGVTEVAKLMRDSIADMIESTFKMYGSAPVKVALEFDDKLTGVVYDKFSEDTTLRRTGERAVMAVVTMLISPTFFGWLFQLEDKMRITSPTSLKEQYKQQAKNTS